MLVKELVTFHSFIQEAKFLAGKEGLNNKITDITVMEAPDFPNWVNGGEFVLSTFFSIKDDIAKQIDIIRQLSENGVAALGIKEGRYVDKIDPLVIQAANDCHFPLFSIKKETKFRHLIRLISKELINIPNDYTQDVIIFYDHMMRLAVSGASPEEICQGISEQSGYPCAIFSLTREKIAGKVIIDCQEDLEGQVVDEQTLINNLLDEFALNAKHVHSNSQEYRRSSFVVVGCPIQGELINILLFSKVNQWKNYESVLARFAANAIGSRFLEEHIQQNIEDRMISSFVDDVIFKEIDQGVFTSRADFFGWKIHDRFQAVVVRLVDEAEISEEAFRLLADRWYYQMKQVFPSVLSVVKKDEFIVLLSIPSDSLFNDPNYHKKKVKDVLSNLFYLSPMGEKIRIGVGSLFDDPLKLKVSYRQARSLIDLGKKREGDLWYSSDYLLELLLLQSRNLTEYQLMKEMILHPLCKNDQQNGTELLKSVQAVIEMGSLESAAEILYVHINTLRNRLKKVAEITGVNPLDAAGRLMFVTVLLDTV